VSLRSPLGRVLGRGAAGEGVSHWWWQRVSAVALVPLALWLMVSLLLLPSLHYAHVVAWLQQPWNAVLLTLFIVVTTYHSALGVQVVIEDYVHGKPIKIFSLLASTFLHVIVAVAGVFAVLKVAV
jgi:succinate dehydrogenase / fumarate reductase, membrane anchor subunit